MMQDLYLVGDSLDDVRLRNRAMELLVVNSDLSAISQFDRIYQHTPVNSPLRKMYVDGKTFGANRPRQPRREHQEIPYRICAGAGCGL